MVSSNDPVDDFEKACQAGVIVGVGGLGLIIGQDVAAAAAQALEAGDAAKAVLDAAGTGAGTFIGGCVGVKIVGSLTE